MATFKIEIPDGAFENIRSDIRDVLVRQLSNELPSYPQFVKNLAKDMPTPAEELHHASTGISGEAGEILDQTKKVWVYGKPLDIRHLIEELGDLRFYYQAILNMLDLTDADIQALNMKKLSVRYASGKYSDAQAIGRADKKIESPRNFIGMPNSPGETK